MLSEKSLLLGSLQEVGQFPAVVSTEGALCVMPDCIWVTHLEEKQKEGCDSWLFMDVWMVVIVYNWLCLLRHSLFKFEYSTWNIRKKKTILKLYQFVTMSTRRALKCCVASLFRSWSLSRSHSFSWAVRLIFTSLSRSLRLAWIRSWRSWSGSTDCVCVLGRGGGRGGGWYVCVLHVWLCVFACA